MHGCGDGRGGRKSGPRGLAARTGAAWLSAAALGMLLAAPPAAADRVASVRGRAVVELPAGRARVPAVDGEFVVQLAKPSHLAPALARAPFARHRAKLHALAPAPRGLHLYRVDLPEGLDMTALQKELAANPYVLRSDPNVIVRPAFVPDDPDFPSQWALDDGVGWFWFDERDADVWAPEAWSITRGDRDVHVYVVDTGIAMQDGELSHPELSSDRIVPFVNTWEPGEPPLDAGGHGTHVAGIAGAETDDGVGVAGVCHECTLHAAKALEGLGQGTLDTVVQAVAAVLLDASVRGEPAVVNLSLRLPDGYDLVGEETAEALFAWPSQHGYTRLLFAVAAGNYAPDCSDAERPVVYPAAYAGEYTEVLAVAASDWTGNPTCWSAKGPEVTLAAPGAMVLAPTPFYDVCVQNAIAALQCLLGGLIGAKPPEKGYDSLSGTSMAAPHVAGAAGLVWSARPDATAAQVREWLIAGADRGGLVVYDDDGWNERMGFGRVNACRSLEAAGAAADGFCARARFLRRNLPLGPGPIPLPQPPFVP